MAQGWSVADEKWLGITNNCSQCFYYTQCNMLRASLTCCVQGKLLTGLVICWWIQNNLVWSDDAGNCMECVTVNLAWLRLMSCTLRVCAVWFGLLGLSGGIGGVSSFCLLHSEIWCLLLFREAIAYQSQCGVPCKHAFATYFVQLVEWRLEVICRVEGKALILCIRDNIHACWRVIAS